MDIELPMTLRKLVRAYSDLPEVEAIGLGGSRAYFLADAQSDYDLYVFTQDAIPLDTRRTIAHQFDSNPEIGNPWWGDEDALYDGSVGYDLSFWNVQDFETHLRGVIEHHRPSLGFSTSFWFTVRHAIILFDRGDWLTRIKEFAEAPYPEPLRDAIVRLNAPLLRSAHASYRHQIELAIGRNDNVSVNHRITAFLESVFDIVFAITRTLHPGEKRQLTWMATLGESVPASLDRHIRDLVLSIGDPSLNTVLPALDAVCDDIDAMIRTMED